MFLLPASFLLAILIAFVLVRGAMHSAFAKFVSLIALSFGLPWLILIVVPAIKHQHLTAVAYDKDKDGMDGFYPPAPINRQGQLVYAREGCVQCHTQMIRPASLGLDAWRKGWGQDQSDRAPEPIRANTMRDYLGEPFAFLGIQRTGPDLANAGWRFTDRKKLHQELYSPRSINSWSTMPAFKHLYIVQKAQGQKSSQAIDLPAKFAPRKGFEVIPTPAAEALVDYLLSLKKDYPIPGMAAAVAAAKK